MSRLNGLTDPGRREPFTGEVLEMAVAMPAPSDKCGQDGEGKKLTKCKQCWAAGGGTICKECEAQLCRPPIDGATECQVSKNCSFCGLFPPKVELDWPSESAVA